MKENTLKSLATSVRRNLNVENATSELEGAVSDLRDVIEALENHLAPLLTQERPKELCKERAEGESELSERIISSSARVGTASARIRELIDRL